MLPSPLLQVSLPSVTWGGRMPGGCGFNWPETGAERNRRAWAQDARSWEPLG